MASSYASTAYTVILYRMRRISSAPPERIEQEARLAARELAKLLQLEVTRRRVAAHRAKKDAMPLHGK